MIRIILLFLLVFLVGCNKPKTVLICGDHECINKQEAEQYFEENLTLEVQIINDQKSKNSNLVELNLKQDANGKRQIDVKPKIKTSKDVKKLSKKDVKQKKIEIKNKEKLKVKMENKSSVKLSKTANNNQKTKKTKVTNYNPQIKKSSIVDICSLIENCSIEEISKFLVKQGKNKKFPDITFREQQ